MSFAEQLSKSVNQIIFSYIKNVAQKYNLDEKELQDIWGSENHKEQTMTNVDTNNISRDRLLKCNKLELSALCKSKGLKCSGNKEDLLNRLLDLNNNETKKVENNTETKKVENKQKTNTIKVDKKLSVVEKLTRDNNPISLRRNAKGVFVHPPTGFVFDPKEEKVIGKEDKDGVSELTEEDIEECKKFKFNYKLPSNLDKKLNLENVKVDELEDIETEEIEEIEEIEETEEIEEIEE